MTNAPFLPDILIVLCRTSVNLVVQRGYRRIGVGGSEKFTRRFLSLSRGAGGHSEGRGKFEGWSAMIIGLSGLDYKGIV